MTLLVGVAAVAALYFGRDVFLPIVLAVLLAFVLAPFVDLLRRLRLGRVFSVIVAVLVALGVIGTLGTVMGLQVAELASDLSRCAADDPRQGRRAEGRRPRPPVDPDAAPRTRDRARDEGRSGPGGDGTPAQAAPEPQQPLPVEVRQPDLTPLELAQRFVAPILHPLAMLGITSRGADLHPAPARRSARPGMIRLVGSSDLRRTTAAMDDAAPGSRRFFLAQLASASPSGSDRPGCG